MILTSATALPGPVDNKKNVLLIFIDDGGFQMGVYGNKAVKTPNIDSFAKRAVVFKHGFTSVSSCSPSRSALLTGIHIILDSDYELNTYLSVLHLTVHRSTATSEWNVWAS